MSKAWAGADIEPVPASIPAARRRQAVAAPASTRRSMRLVPGRCLTPGRSPRRRLRATASTQAAAAVEVAATAHPQGTQARPTAAAMSSVGVSVPSEQVEWVWGSMRTETV